MANLKTDEGWICRPSPLPAICSKMIVVPCLARPTHAQHVGVTSFDIVLFYHFRYTRWFPARYERKSSRLVAWRCSSHSWLPRTRDRDSTCILISRTRSTIWINGFVAQFASFFGWNFGQQSSARSWCSLHPFEHWLGIFVEVYSPLRGRIINSSDNLCYRVLRGTLVRRMNLLSQGADGWEIEEVVAVADFSMDRDPIFFTETQRICKNRCNGNFKYRHPRFTPEFIRVCLRFKTRGTIQLFRTESRKLGPVSIKEGWFHSRMKLSSMYAYVYIRSLSVEKQRRVHHSYDRPVGCAHGNPLDPLSLVSTGNRRGSVSMTGYPGIVMRDANAWECNFPPSNLPSFTVHACSYRKLLGELKFTGREKTTAVSYRSARSMPLCRRLSTITHSKNIPL